MNPDRSTVRARAAALRSANRAEDAIPLLVAAIGAAPEDHELVCELAVTHHTLGDRERAIALAQQAIALEPTAEWPHRIIGHAHLAERRPLEALRAAEQSISLEPDLASTHRLAAEAARMLGWAERARWEAERALELDPGEPYGFRILASVAFLEGDLPAARSAATKAVELNPDDPASLHQLGAILELLGEPDEAARLYLAAQRADPTGRRSREALELLLGRPEVDRLGTALIAYGAWLLAAALVPSPVGTLAVVAAGGAVALGALAWRAHQRRRDPQRAEMDALARRLVPRPRRRTAKAVVGLGLPAVLMLGLVAAFGAPTPATVSAGLIMAVQVLRHGLRARHLSRQRRAELAAKQERGRTPPPPKPVPAPTPAWLVRPPANPVPVDSVPPSPAPAPKVWAGPSTPPLTRSVVPLVGRSSRPSTVTRRRRLRVVVQRRRLVAVTAAALLAIALGSGGHGGCTSAPTDPTTTLPYITPGP